MYRRTLIGTFEIDGVGVHTGEVAVVRVGPAPWGAGLRFHAWGGDASVPALRAFAEAGSGCTVLTRGAMSVQTPEHLLAALYGAGITDARIDIRGPEVPILDGSAHIWSGGIASAGVCDGPSLAPLILPELRVEHGPSWAQVAVGRQPFAAVEVDFDEPGLPSGRASVVLEGECFREEVAWARTFVLERDLARLRQAGRGRGASLANTLVYGPEGVVNLGGERSPQEAVRHKLLDLVGDLALLGGPFLGRVTVHRGSHQLHLEVVEEILQTTDRRRRGSRKK